MGDAVSDFTYHRAASHAFFFMALAAPLILWLILKIHPSTVKYKTRWLLLIILTFFTHALLDSFTVYGTQIFLPFSNFPVGWSTIFVIDPLYTLPLLTGVASLFILKDSPAKSYKFNILGIIISSLYLLWTIGLKAEINEIAEESLRSQNIETERILSSPAPFNTFLWRVIAKSDSNYYEGFYSIFDDNDRMKFRRYSSNESLLYPIENEWSVKRLKWFSKGFYKVSELEGKIVISDLRMGVEPLYFFSFAVGEISGGIITPRDPEQIENAEFNMNESIRMLWDRIWNEDIDRLFTSKSTE